MRQLLSVMGNCSGGKNQAVQAQYSGNPKYEEVENQASLISNVSLGAGYTIMSRLVAENNPELEGVALLEEFDMEIHAVWKKSNDFVTSLMTHI